MQGKNRSGCRCGGPCHYCGRALSPHWHEHDHFPIPKRHGGTETVPACLECHDMKDRRRPPGINAEWGLDEPIMAAIEVGYEAVGSRAFDASSGVSVPLAVYELFLRTTELREQTEPSDFYYLADEVVAMAGIVARAVGECSTPEAKVSLAWTFCTWLDTTDRSLRPA